MIQSVQKVQNTESVICKPKKNFNGAVERKASPFSSPLQAAEFKYNLACLWAATVQMENKQLRQELANSSAQAAYCRACFK